MIRKNSLNIAKGIVWDLSELYSGSEDTSLEKDLSAVQERCRKFVSSFKGYFNPEKIDVPTLTCALKEYEAIHEMGMKPYVFGFLWSSYDTQDIARTELFQKIREKWNEVSKMLTFFILDITGLSDDLLRRLSDDDSPSDYRHFFHKLIERRPYTLSEAAERAIKNKSLSGRVAFEDLYDELIGSLSFPVDVEKKRRHLNTEQAFALLYLPDRSLRERAFKALLRELGNHAIVFKNILNALILDYHQENMERGYLSPMHRMNLSNGLEESLIEAMMKATEDHYSLAKRYFRLKSRLMGLTHLKNTDMFAPIKDEHFSVGFLDAKHLLLDSMENLHPLLHSLANAFFEKCRIDAEMRTGKLAGAYCKCVSPSIPAYISMNYTGEIKDILTLAHELGHGIHYSLSSRQRYLNFRPSPILAETASTFLEITVAWDLMQKEDFQGARTALIASQIDGILKTVFRQGVLTRFEQVIHSVRQDHILSEQEISKIWLEENLRLYGKEVEMVPGYNWAWACVPHFFHRPFYCYSYIFGNLISILLFQNYRVKGKVFLEKLIRIFSSGSSRATLDMFSEIGLKPGGKSFWEPAFQYIEEVIDDLALLHRQAFTKQL